MLFRGSAGPASARQGDVSPPEVLLLCLLAVLAEAETITDIARFGAAELTCCTGSGPSLQAHRPARCEVLREISAFALLASVSCIFAELRGEGCLSDPSPPPNTADCPLWHDIAANHRTPTSWLAYRRFYATARYILNFSDVGMPSDVLTVQPENRINC